MSQVTFLFDFKKCLMIALTFALNKTRKRPLTSAFVEIREANERLVKLYCIFLCNRDMKENRENQDF